MPSTRSTLLAAIVFAGTLGGCATAPPPTYHLTPSTADVVWVAGRPSAQQERDGLQIAVTAAGQMGGVLGLHVQISNAGAARFEVSPRDVTFTACTGTVNASCAPTERVIDPEVELAKIDRRAHDERASASVTQGLLGFLLVLNAVGDITSVASGHAHHHTGAGTVATAGLMEGNAASTDRALSRLETERDFWTNTALRRSTVDAGQSAAGVVLVPIYPTARYVWVHVRIGEQRFSFPFDQTATMPAT